MLIANQKSNCYFKLLVIFQLKYVYKLIELSNISIILILLLKLIPFPLKNYVNFVSGFNLGKNSY